MSWDIPIGTQFAGYKITDVLGRGGMSVVYAAEHVSLGRMVALKLLAPQLAMNESFRERFIRESQLAASLDHPNIIPIYDAGEAEGFLYIVMRHVEGPDLRSLIEQEGPLPLGQTLFYMEQVARALDQAHERGLVHRDVKPGNILIAKPADRVYLTDFGVVKETSSRGLTKTGFFLGTFEYAAPEQIEGKPVDGRTDLYALGCVLYECLSGEPPFDAETEGSIIHAHLTESPPKLTAKRPDLSLAINDVITTAMAKSKEDRYPSCGEFARAIRNAAFGEDVARAPLAAPAAAAAAPSSSTTAEPSATPPSPPTYEMAPTPSAPPGRREPRSFALSARQLLLGGAVLAALIAAAIVAAVLLAGGGNSKGTTKAGTSGARQTTPSGGLLAALPSDVPTNKCSEKASDHPGGLHTVECDYTDTAGRRILLHLDDFKSRKFLYATYKDHGVGDEEKAGGQPDPSLRSSTGACSGTEWLGEGTWSHGGGMHEVAGRRACFLVNGNSKVCKPTGAPACSVIVWTLDISNLFQRAVLPSTQHRNLLTWWKFHAHLFG
jgi:serine/threonine-protein kinase